MKWRVRSVSIGRPRRRAKVGWRFGRSLPGSLIRVALGCAADAEPCDGGGPWLAGFDEDDLYANLDWLAERQADRVLSGGGQLGTF